LKISCPDFHFGISLCKHQRVFLVVPPIFIGGFYTCEAKQS
jgi:hypothetical protein